MKKTAFKTHKTMGTPWHTSKEVGTARGNENEDKHATTKTMKETPQLHTFFHDGGAGLTVDKDDR